MLDNYYDEAEKPQDFSLEGMMNEVLRSYNLIFRDDRKARKIFQQRERGRAAFCSIVVDPLLDNQSGANLSTHYFCGEAMSKQSYDCIVEFPIFSERLLRIQSFVEGIEPSHLKSLWRDKRDLQRWYTLWAVLAVGVFSLFVGLGQLVLSLVQVVLTIRSLELDKQAACARVSGV